METNNVSPDKKDSILKSLAIAGFVGILLLVAWLAVQLVHLFPGAFTSLASLAEGVNQYQETIIDIEEEVGELKITGDTSLLNTGEELSVEWSEVNSTGSYVFSYECIDGIAIEHIANDGVRSIDCGTNYNVGDTNTLTMTIESEKNRYADVPYTIAFLRTSDTEPRAVGGNTVTIVNTDINNQFAFDTANETPAVSEEVEGPITEVTTPTAPNTLTPGQPTYTQEFVYTVPVSNPNGFTDLGATYIAVGEVINQSFVTGPVSIDNDGAIQFFVKNYGTKTSRTWTYEVELPNGDTYESPTQDALKPNERAVITIGFPAGANTPHTFAVTVDESTDRNESNDSFRQTVAFVR